MRTMRLSPIGPASDAVDYKIIFTGPTGAGKTSAISCLSDIPIIGTDVGATDAVRSGRKRTTVAMDYGYRHLSPGEGIHLYGTPGQDRFNFMWDILCQGGLGLILLVDATSADPVGDCLSCLGAFDGFIRRTGAVIGITRADIAENMRYERVQDVLIEKGYAIPVLEVDARDSDDVNTLVHSLLAVL